MRDCIFCQISQGKVKSWKVYENEYVYAFFDINPVNEYHTLIIPKKHFKDIFDIPEFELKEIMSAIKLLSTLYKEKIGIENVQIINSSGNEAQQDVFHIHFHIVPRHKEDKQDIKWNPRIELREKFDKMIDVLKK
jgi:histidine triad (HIT) family protein